VASSRRDTASPVIDFPTGALLAAPLQGDDSRGMGFFEGLSPDPATYDVLVIGYGSRVRGDDALGPIVADQLSRLFTTEYSISVVSTHQLTFDLSEMVSRARCVVLIDAATGGVPGTITCRRVEPEGESAPSMLHHMEAGALLASTQVLYGVVPPTYIWSMVGDAFEFGESLSPALERAVPELVKQLTQFIRMLGLHQSTEEGAVI
jgi:hydrogenase maturation protease